MATLTAISLDQHWLYRFADRTGTDYSQSTGTEADWLPLTRLVDWVVSCSGQSGADWFLNSFALTPTTPPLRYVLQVDGAPDKLTIFVNGAQIGTLSHAGSFECDITRQVVPGINRIVFKLTCSRAARGVSFATVRLLSALGE